MRRLSLTSLHIVVERQHSLLQVVDGNEGACAANACAAVEHNLVVHWNVGQLLRVEQVFATSLAPMVCSQVFNDCLYNFVVLLLWSSEVRPRQILQLRHDSTRNDNAVGVFVSQLKSPLN